MIARKTLRCAIYTRVSTEHGLEQEFNSLYAQREAAEAYIKSQAHEGWTLLPERYDDGGYSGGSLSRPAVQELLHAIRNREIDVIVVYKVDRLTRSLADFARLIELFDECAVSFVSVTQSFNTTTSMGRLTLNVLLSFAQFEREVTGERIRDKIAASKKKGLWMGGNLPLGYRVEERSLMPVATEADLVRSLFRRYLEHGSVTKLHAALRNAGEGAPLRTNGKGKTIGGVPFSRGNLYKILSNPVYIGRIVHKDRDYEGQHDAIIDDALWKGVQTKLAGQTVRQSATSRPSALFLSGKLYDDAGNRMGPSWTSKGVRRYRYYVSQALLQNIPGQAGSIKRVAAQSIEEAVIAAVAHLEPDQSRERNAIAQLLDHVVIGNAGLTITTTRIDETGKPLIVYTVWKPEPTRRKREIILCERPPGDPKRPMRTEAHSKLIPALARAHTWLDELLKERITLTDLAAREKLSPRTIRTALSLAFVAPDIVTAALERRLPRGFGMSRLANLPVDWKSQRTTLGLPDSTL